MMKLEIDGKNVECEPGSMIIEAADNAGIYIPRFCYHKKLSIAANCRMCLVEVEKSAKPLPACATPVNEGMRVFTKSKKAIEAQKYVLEYLLINHPLDCPICDQGGECELQDLSMGFGPGDSVYTETKRSVDDENLGPLIATDMTRCIHCTRCVRFGDEIAGVPELGMLNRGENSKITTYLRHTLTSELSANIIDLCPVGALTSKPFRFKARAWELEQTPIIAVHDCVGSNIYIHTLRGTVMRIVPHDNEAINETWISDRDRFSYLGLQHKDRIMQPKVKYQGQWQDVDWVKAFEYAAKGLKEILRESGPENVAALLHPSTSMEEAYLLKKVMHGLGCYNIDYRIQQSDFRAGEVAPLAEVKFAEIPEQDCIFLLGSNIRREQPVLSDRVRSCVRQEGTVVALNPLNIQFNFAVKAANIVHPDDFVAELAGIAKALKADESKITPSHLKVSLKDIEPSKNALNLAETLLATGSKKIILIGALALNHPRAAEIKSLARIIGNKLSARILELPSGANSHGIYQTNVISKSQVNAKSMFGEKLRAYLLYGIEPEFDCANPAVVTQGLKQADFVIAFSAYTSAVLEECADVILPIVPFSETDGTYVNAQYDQQYFKAVVAPYGDARPGWKVLRVFGNMLELEGFDYVTWDEVRNELQMELDLMPQREGGIFDVTLDKTGKKSPLTRIAEWPLYRIDGIVRRSEALQLCGASETCVARMNSNTAKKYEIAEGDKVKVTQNSVATFLTANIDAAIPDACVYVANAYDQTTLLGESFGAITIERAL